MTDFDDEAPLTTRGVPRTRFDPLRDAAKAKAAEPIVVEGVNDRGEGPFDPDEVSDAISAVVGQNRGFESDFGPGSGISATEALISAVRSQITALGLTETVEGNHAIVAAEKAADASGSAAAACLSELRQVMKEIRAQKPSKAAADPTEDVLSRRRERKVGG
jgi:hypothetical protein